MKFWYQFAVRHHLQSDIRDVPGRPGRPIPNAATWPWQHPHTVTPTQHTSRATQLPDVEFLQSFTRAKTPFTRLVKKKKLEAKAFLSF